MTESPGDRASVLARRVRWLDRYRRAIAIVCAVIVFGLMTYELHVLLGPQWPGVLSSLLAILAASATWWIVEVGFAWLTALWETEHDLLLRDRGLPSARLLPRRR